MKKLLIAMLLSVGTVFPLRALELNEVLFKLEQTERNIHALKFDFSQEIKFAEADMNSAVSGKAIFTSDKQWWIERDRPNKQITISNGQKMWVYTPDYNQVWEGKWKSWLDSDVIPKGLIPLSNYVSELKNNFDPSIKKDDSAANQIVLFFSPKARDAGYSLEMAISKESWLPVTTTFKSESAVVVTQLKNMEVNPQVNSALFQFKPPQGVDIISVN